jgi:Domain of unknown function (DUF4253)
MTCELHLTYGDASVLWAGHAAGDKAGLCSVLVPSALIMGSKICVDISDLDPAALAENLIKNRSKEISAIRFNASLSAPANNKRHALDKASFGALIREGDCLVSTERDTLWCLPIIIGLPPHNNRPAAAEIAGMLWRWKEHCGAQLVRLDTDGLVAIKEMPFKSASIMAATAKEHLSFNHELFNEYSPDEYLEHISNSIFWTFWWD